MKITTPERVAPDESHVLDPALFGDDDRFELSTIRPEDSSIAIELLIGNYAAPMDAVIRELYVNASDSHRAAGQTRPVEITMPTEETPFLVVRDFGLGMSPTDMVGVFTRPAASTKRGENTSAGGLGIGAKSPFTVADRFVVRGVKDGVAATLVMARIDGHLMHLVNEVTATDAANGVEITVPIEVSKIEQWWKALSRVHFWWDQGRAVITNEDSSPVALPTWSERILEGAPAPEGQAVVHSPKLRRNTVLMGQIAYSIPEGVLYVHHPLLYVVPVGAVRIAPNRESVVDTEENREVLRGMAHAWQEEQFAELAARILDPSTSLISLSRIEADLKKRSLRNHFYEWASRALLREVSDYRLPPVGYGSFTGFLTHDIKVEMRAHGVPEDAAARAVSSFSELMYLGAGSDTVRRVFIDSRSLPESRRKVLTKWARAENVIAVIVDREKLETVRFHNSWGRLAGAEDYTRPYADPDEIEWVDPADVRVERAVRKNPSPAPTGSSPITVIGLSAHYRRHETVTVDELVEHTKKRSNRWVIVDTMAEIDKIDLIVPPTIVAVSIGQRPVALLKTKLASRALTAAEFKVKSSELVERSLTAVQKRVLADTVLARLDGVHHLFRSNTGWIERTEEPAVRAIAAEISGIVTRSLREYENRQPKPSTAQQVMAWAQALRLQLNDPDWLVKHASLGKYAPALIAARSNGLLPHHWSFSDTTIEHVRTTIATQLVKS